MIKLLYKIEIFIYTKVLPQNTFIFDFLTKMMVIQYVYIIWGREKFLGQNGVVNEKSLRSADLDNSFWNPNDVFAFIRSLIELHFFISQFSLF